MFITVANYFASWHQCHCIDNTHILCSSGKIIVFKSYAWSAFIIVALYPQFCLLHIVYCMYPCYTGLPVYRLEYKHTRIN